VTNVAGTLPILSGQNDLSTIPPAYFAVLHDFAGNEFLDAAGERNRGVDDGGKPLLTPDQVVTDIAANGHADAVRRTHGRPPVTSDAHNAVRIAIRWRMTASSANLFHRSTQNAPQIVDPADDQLGTTAQDIREGRFVYDAAANSSRLYAYVFPTLR
jgi:hypothetical protein